MNLLQQLVILSEGDDLTRLPQDIINDIKRNIRKGAEDLTQKWANALELVHKAFEVEGVERPDPTMKEAWKQYEELLQYAVDQLAKNRGIDGDWRMSSAIFHEALKEAITPKQSFRVTLDDQSYVVEGEDIDSVTNQLVESFRDLDVSITETLNSRIVSFSKWGIKHKTKAIIEVI